VAGEVADVYLRLEESWKAPLLGNPALGRVREQVEALAERLPARRRRDNWRGLLLQLRATADDLLQRKLVHAARAEQAVRATLRPESAPRDAADLAERLGTALGLLDQAAQERELSELKDRVRALDEAVHAIPAARIHLPLIRLLDVDVGHIGWDRRQLEAASETLGRGGDATLEEAWRVVHDVATYDDPGPGGWYDDLGHPGRSPHLRRGHGVTLLQGLDPQNRPSHNRCARSYRGESGVLLSYAGLEPDVAYQVRLTYVGLPTRAAARLVQRLEANGREVHPNLEVPARTAQQLTFPVPRDAYPFGQLDLEWSPAPGGNGSTAVSEVWLIRAAGEGPGTLDRLDR
jgi:hypothetical protein